MFGLVPYINKPLEPNPIYNQNYWNNLGGQAALDLPLLGLGLEGGPRDYSKNGNVCTLNTHLSWELGNYLSADGLGLGTIPYSEVIAPVLPFALILRIRYTTTSNLVICEVNGNTGFSVQVMSGGALSCWTNGFGPSTNKAYNDGKWHTIIFNLTGSTTTDFVMVDGVSDTNTATGPSRSPSYASQPMYLASRNGSFGFVGDLDGPLVLLPYALTLGNAAAFSARPWSRFSYKQNIFYQSPSSGTTINLTSKSFVFSSSNVQESVSRPISSQVEDQSESQANITITRPLNSNADAQSFVTTATSSIARALNSKFISQTDSKAQETVQRALSSSIVIDQSFAQGKLTFGAIINLQGKALVQSLSQVQISLGKALNSKSFDFTLLLAEINVKQNLNSKSTGQSKSSAQETIARPLSAEQINQAESLAEPSVQRLLDSNSIAQSLAKGQFTTQLYTHMQLTCFRRYSSQYFVQSGSVEDDGQ